MTLKDLGKRLIAAGAFEPEAMPLLDQWSEAVIAAQLLNLHLFTCTVECSGKKMCDQGRVLAAEWKKKTGFRVAAPKVCQRGGCYFEGNSLEISAHERLAHAAP